MQYQALSQSKCSQHTERIFSNIAVVISLLLLLEAGVAGLPQASTDSRVTEWPQGWDNGSPVTVTVLLTVTVTVIY